MSTKSFDAVLEANDQYTRNFGEKGKLAMPPARRFAILTCMDARLDPAKYAGLAEGDAHVIRNAGGRATDDAIRSLVISHKLLGTNEWFIIHHNNCGMETFSDEIMSTLLDDNLATAYFDGKAWSNPKHGGGSVCGHFINWHTIKISPRACSRMSCASAPTRWCPAISRFTASYMTWRPGGSTRWRRQARPVGRQLERWLSRRKMSANVQKRSPPSSIDLSSTRGGRTSNIRIGRQPNAARLLLQIFSFVRYGVEELRDLLVHELNVGSFRRRCREVALKRWDHDVLRARNMFRIVCGFGRRIVKITF